MKILLLNAPPLVRFGIVGQIYPPLGILYLAAYLRQGNRDYEFKVVDGYHEKNIEEVVKTIVAFAPDILGVSMTTQAATGGYEVIRRVRQQLKNVFIVCGGAHPTIFPGEALLRGQADAVVLGEGEITFAELAAALAAHGDYRNLPGLAFRSGEQVVVNPARPLIKDLDTLPFPARDLLDIRRYPGYHYKKSSWDTSYISGRGCPFNCTYCSNPVWKLTKPWIRLRSPQNIADEIEHLKKTYGVREFYDQTDLFNSGLPWAKSVADEFIKRKLNVFWKVQMTVKNVDQELADKMVASGCWLGLVGVETGNDATARGINKRTDIRTAEESLTFLKNAGMKTFALLMAFNVWEEDNQLKYENYQDTLKTLEFAKRMVWKGKIDLMSWSLTTPYPGSQVYEIAKKYRLIPENLEGRWEFFDSSENFIMQLPGVTAGDWAKIKNKGKRLQIFLLFKSGTFNWRSIPIYLKKLGALLGHKFLAGQ